MLKELETIFSHFERELAVANKERDAMGSTRLGFCEITLLGQFSLLASDDKNLSKVNIRRTDDLDALLSGDQGTAWLFRKSVKECGLEFDDLSGEIWIPDNSTFIKIRENVTYRLLALDPLSALVSKAVKAPEKNKILIREALQAFGLVLEDRLREYNVDLNFFVKGK